MSNIIKRLLSYCPALFQARLIDALHRSSYIYTVLPLYSSFRSIFAAVGNDTIVFVFGDHGMTASGDHGGESEMETTAALLVFTPRPIFHPHQV